MGFGETTIMTLQLFLKGAINGFKTPKTGDFYLQVLNKLLQAPHLPLQSLIL